MYTTQNHTRCISRRQIIPAIIVINLLINPSGPKQRVSTSIHIGEFLIPWLIELDKIDEEKDFFEDPRRYKIKNELWRKLNDQQWLSGNFTRWPSTSTGKDPCTKFNNVWKALDCYRTLVSTKAIINNVIIASMKIHYVTNLNAIFYRMIKHGQKPHRPNCNLRVIMNFLKIKKLEGNKSNKRLLQFELYFRITILQWENGKKDKTNFYTKFLLPFIFISVIRKKSSVEFNLLLRNWN